MYIDLYEAAHEIEIEIKKVIIPKHTIEEIMNELEENLGYKGPKLIRT